MGKKLTKLSCIKSRESPKTDNRPRKPKRTKSILSKTTADKETQDLVFVDHSTNAAPDIVIQNADVSGVVNISSVEQDQRSKLVLMPTRELNGLQKLEPITECEENSTGNRCETLVVPQNKLVAQLIQDTSKKIGNSIELLHCPDMSTISMFTEQSYMKNRRGVAAGAPAVKVLTPNVTDDEFTLVTPLPEQEEISTMEMTASTLNVPPNSVNSQFISGITPMDSMQDPEYPDATADSVFAHDLSYFPEHCLDAIYFANYGAGRVYLNNNSMVASPEYVNVKSGGQSQKAVNSISVEVSDGPGLDSDFGASAGIEMRIVSSDYSGANTTSAANDKAHATLEVPSLGITHLSVPETSQKLKKTCKRPRRVVPNVQNFANRTLPILEMAPTIDANKCLSYGLVLRDSAGNRRPATVGGPEGLFHVTMEWDPYDTDYGKAHWREYFIPGVSYPQHPLLCPEEHWM